MFRMIKRLLSKQHNPPVSQEVVRDVIKASLAGGYLIKRKKYISTELMDTLAADALIEVGVKYDLLPPAFYEQVLKEVASDRNKVRAADAPKMEDVKITDDKGNEYQPKEPAHIFRDMPIPSGEGREDLLENPDEEVEGYAPVPINYKTLKG
jgi:hypothetical protein